ncbi:MAG: hypothetical protein WCW93_00715 [Candidatus Paceibacterota bacterium]
MVDTIYTSKTHIFTSWILVVFGVIATIFALFALFVLTLRVFISVVSFCTSQFCSTELFIFLLPIISFIFGLHGFWKAGKLKFVSWVLIIFGLIISCFTLFLLFIVLPFITNHIYVGVGLSLLFIFSLSCLLFGLRELSKIKNLNNKFTHINYEI